jgi:hypothetical protein
VQASVAITAPGAGELAEAAAVYAAAFGQAPCHEDDQQASAFAERVVRYPGERDGFRFATARDGEGRMSGLALAGIGTRLHDALISSAPAPPAC